MVISGCTGAASEPPGGAGCAEFLAALLVSGMAWGQAAETPKPAAPEGQGAPITQPGSAAQVQAIAPAGAGAAAPSDPNAAVIPAGTKLPLGAEAGNLHQECERRRRGLCGNLISVCGERPRSDSGRDLHPGEDLRTRSIRDASKRRAEILIHFTSMIYPSGYTVMLPGSVENTPGADDKGVKDKEGTIQADK